ncbi:MAG: riboflavin kinase/FMN adenylyltransferase [Candidatus Deianiraeaceae bacterium]|jgi:riboflavin kinase/FMN adenylyltransferase
MKKIKCDINSLPSINVEALCIGKFDGIHLGHEALLGKSKEFMSCGVLTFSPLPFIYFKRGNNTIYTEEERAKTIQTFGMNLLIVLQFDNTIAKMTGEEFLSKISQVTNNIIVGEDFRFGVCQSCGVEDLITMQNKFKYTAHVVERVGGMEEKVSSSQLKKCIQSGNFKQYSEVSNIPYFVNGMVEKGMQMAGKVLGFPTANIQIDNTKVVPPYGVYLTRTTIDGEIFPSISNYGIKPTITEEKIPILETHIFDFTKEIYGKEIHVALLSKIRDEVKFSDIKKLQFQIMEDIKVAKNLHYANYQI